MEYPRFLTTNENYYDPEFISIDPDKIEFVEDKLHSRAVELYYQDHKRYENPHEHYEKRYDVIYNGRIKTEFMDIKGKIGAVFVKTKSWKFEDYLQVERKFDKAVNYTIISSKNMLPFALQPWLSSYSDESDSNLGLSQRMKEHVFFHYNECNRQSVQAQKELNYDEHLHRKFAMIDHIINGCLAGSGMGLAKCQPIRFFYIDNHVVDAMEILMDKKLIEPESRDFDEKGVSAYAYRLSGLGNISQHYGFGKAREFNREEKRNEKIIQIAERTKILTYVVIFVTIITPILEAFFQDNPKFGENEMSKQEVFEYMEYKLETERMYRFLPTS